MNLYVIRHGRTNLNNMKKYNGQYDEDINDIGINQALAASKNVKNLAIDLIICSPLLRTKHTCDIINVNNVPVIYDERLIERDNGIIELTKFDDIYTREEYYDYYATDLPKGLESLPDLFKRIHMFLDELKIIYNDKNILLVTHGAVSRAIQFYFEKMPSDGKLLNVSGQKNCEIKKYKL